jgi:hypothetical protein
MQNGFVGGVHDAQGWRGFIPIGGNQIAAVDLRDGVALWRRDGVGHPIAATSTRLLALDRDGKSFVIRLLDAATGADIGRILQFGMPDWAQEVGTEADALQIQGSETPAGVEIACRLRKPYRGGAAPSAQIAAGQRDEVSGAVLVDPQGGQIAPAPAFTTASKDVPGEPDLGPYVPAAPDVVAIQRVGDRVFALKAESRPGARQSTLEARDAKDGSKVWEAPLAEIDSGEVRLSRGARSSR